MSLFEQPGYRWRETYMVLFQAADRPLAESVRAAVRGLGGRFDVSDVQANSEGFLDSMTVKMRGESTALDVIYTGDEDVTEQLPDLVRDLRHGPDSEEGDRIDSVAEMTARLDVLHFYQQMDDASDEELDDFVDPGSLLIVLDCLCHLCHGIAVDPQSSSFIAMD